MREEDAPYFVLFGVGARVAAANELFERPRYVLGTGSSQHGLAAPTLQLWWWCYGDRIWKIWEISANPHVGNKGFLLHSSLFFFKKKKVGIPHFPLNTG